MFRGWEWELPSLNEWNWTWIFFFKHSVLDKEGKLRKETLLEKNNVDLNQKEPVCEHSNLPSKWDYKRSDL